MKKNKKGVIIFVSSRSGIEGFENESAYCASKHGLEGLMKSLAIEGSKNGIQVFTVTPGMFMNTPMSEQNYDEAYKKKWVDPIGENSKFSEVKKENYTFPIKGTFENYYFDVGNIRFLMMSDINQKNQIKGRKVSDL